jgi:two-component system, LuxR family, sensor kinase FixL
MRSCQKSHGRAGGGRKRFSLNANVACLVCGDRVQLQQVVLNLLINAFDAMKDGTAQEHNVKVRAIANGAGTVEISVRDHGTGLTSDSVSKIFQPFCTTKRAGARHGPLHSPVDCRSPWWPALGEE